MTTARTLARATQRKLAQVLTIPPAAGEMVERILERHFVIHAALAALQPLTQPTSVLVKEGYIPVAPELTNEEWSKLAEMMADGRLPLMHSFPELTRALLKLREDKP